MNPDYTEQVRTDLEFYIPQLCSYYLKEPQEEELAKFIILACQSSIFFSHRVMFFLSTFSDSEDAEIERRCGVIFNGISSFSKTDGPFNPIHDSFEVTRKVQNILQKYRENEEKGGILEKIKVEDFKLQRFELSSEDNLIDNSSGYMSTPYFVKTLTNLCEIVLLSENKEKTLVEGLDKINCDLPGRVYAPFVENSIRNYSVLHIRVTEAKVFCTKTRAPFLCVLELVRPEELDFTLDYLSDHEDQEEEGYQEKENFSNEYR